MRKKKLNYIAAEEEIRRIAAGRNEQCRTVFLLAPLREGRPARRESLRRG